jgi:mono/diheme cytochrome c family protein
MNAIALLLLICSCLLLGAAPVTAGASDAVLERGRAIAEKNCARCHAVGATGESPLKPAPPFRDLPQRYPVENLAEALAEGIVTGHSAMPEFTFAPDEIDALLTYIGSLGQGAPTKTKP